jgi:hypothetical protein
MGRERNVAQDPPWQIKNKNKNLLIKNAIKPKIGDPKVILSQANPKLSTPLNFEHLIVSYVSAIVRYRRAYLQAKLTCSPL